ncbi:MAG: YfhO family protein [Oscillospiraceae bacterium]|nr:YfhO family protein [Oscillospiraceae bacterium]
MIKKKKSAKPAFLSATVPSESANTAKIPLPLNQPDTPFYKIKMFFITQPHVWISFCIGFVAMLLAYSLYGVWPVGNRSVLCLDMNAQYVYYHIYMRDVLFNGESLLYSWSRNYSGEFVGTMGYYLVSPFNIIVWLLPIKFITEGLLLMILTKIGFSAVAMALYLGTWRKFNTHTTVMFSVMYALTAYNIVHTMNPMFLDGVIALPLVVLGVEALLKEGKYKLLTLMLAYSFLTNFYIGFMIGIFAALYFIYYALTSRRLDCRGNWLVLFKRAGLFTASAVCAVMMSAFLLFPVYASLQLGKFDFSEPDYTFKLWFEFMEVMRKFVLNSYDTVRPNGRPMLFSGTLALVLLPAYFALPRVRRARRFGGIVLMLVLVFSMLIKPIDILWHGGQVPNWLPFRYSFMLGFLMLAFGAEVMHNIRKVSRYSLLIGVVLFGCVIGYWQVSDTMVTMTETAERDVFPFVKTVLPALGTLVLYTVLLAITKNRLNKFGVLSMIVVALVCAEMTLSSLYNLHMQNIDISYSNRDSFKSMVITREVTDELNREMKQRDEFYRMEKTFARSANDPMALRMRGLTHSSSMMNANALVTMKRFGYEARSHSAVYIGATPVSDSLFGFRYILSAPSDSHWSVESREDIDVNFNENALPVAFLANPRVRDFVLDEHEVLDNQTKLFSNILGENNNPYFVRQTPTDKRPENVNFKMIGAYQEYRRIAANANAHIEYDFVADEAGEFYLYFPTGYERATNLWLKRYDNWVELGETPAPEFLGQMYMSGHHYVRPLGHFEKGEPFMVTVSIPLEGDVMFFSEEYVVRADEELLTADVARIRQMNENTHLTVKNNRHLKLTTNYNESSVLFTSIPTEPGWSAYVNGKKVPIKGIANWQREIKTDDEEPNEWVDQSAFIAIDVPPGENEIVLKFFPKNMDIGLIISLAGLAGFLLLSAVMASYKKGQTATDGETVNDIKDILKRIGADTDADADDYDDIERQAQDERVQDVYDGYDPDYVLQYDDE